MEEKVCKVAGCGGEVDLKDSIPLQTGCQSFTLAYPCSKCGRMHWGNGNTVFSRSGASLYVLNGNLHRDENTRLLTVIEFPSTEAMASRDCTQAKQISEVRSSQQLASFSSDGVLAERNIVFYSPLAEATENQPWFSYSEAMDYLAG